MTPAPDHADVVVLVFGGRRIPGSLRAATALAVSGDPDIDSAASSARRLIVVGTPADLAAVLTRLLRTERLDVEVGRVRRWRASRRLLTAPAGRVPLIRDETATVIVGAAHWLPPEPGREIEGEAVVDDTALFDTALLDGRVTGVWIEPTTTAPGLRAAVVTGTALSDRLRPKRWIAGRAAQLGTTGALVVRDGVPAARPLRRSTFYRHTQGWLRVE